MDQHDLFAGGRHLLGQTRDGLGRKVRYCPLSVMTLPPSLTNII